MNLAALFDSFALAAAPIAVAGIWQGVAIVLALGVSLKLTRRISAAHRFALWFAAFMAVVALPLTPVVPMLAGHASVAASSGANTQHAWLQLDARWTFAIAALWLVASLARAADLIVHVARLRRLWHTAAPVDIPTLPQSARDFEVCATQSLDRASVIGFFAPRVLIPDWLLPRLTPGELNQIVLHESTHLARRDDWTNLFQKLCLVLFPLNPALWGIDRQLAKERERSCDEAVVRITQAPRAYAACLASLAERGLAYRNEALSLGAWRRRSELVDRVHRILRSHRLMHPAAARVLLASLGCSLLVVTIELARCPQLVAFGPATHAVSTTASNNLHIQFGDASYPTNPRRAMLSQGAHIVQARATMQTASLAKPLAGRAHMKTRAVGELRAIASEPGVSMRDPRELAAEQPSLEAGAPQFIVLTACEQIETTAPANQTAADYETPPDGTKPQASADRQRRTTFTQLILRVAPAGAKSSQPTAISIGNGWFVLQL